MDNDSTNLPQPFVTTWARINGHGWGCGYPLFGGWTPLPNRSRRGHPEVK